MALVSKNFSDIITFTRASSATYFDATGVLQTATTDAPRFDYDPSTLAARGLLIEEARTNIQTYSAEVGTTTGSSYGIIQANGTVTLNDAVAPDGTTTATSWIEDLTTSGRYISSVNFTPSLNTYYTISVFVKIASGSRYFGILFAAGAGWAGATTPTVVFELSGSGTVTSTSGSPGFISASIQPVGNGWYRCAATALSDPTSTTASRIQLRLSNSSTSAAPSYAGDGTSGVYIWGAQLEEGEFPTSYIPTVASTVTRAVDVAQVNTLSPWFNASEGTLYAQAEVAQIALTQRSMALIGRSTSAAQDIALYISRSADSRQLAIVSNATTQFQYGPAGAVTSSKGALAYKTDDSQAAFNGTASSVDTSVTLPVAVTTLYLGNDDSGILVLNGWLKRVTYYPRRLSQAELETITT
jgi:hypothetical protein